MIEEEARAWIGDRFGTSALTSLNHLTELVVAESANQNLIAPSTIPAIWSRHIADSAQLIGLAPAQWSTWLDVGTGGGFPGLVVACLAADREVVMVEPRRKRAEFLQQSVAALRLPHALVKASKVEAVSCSADVISARAVASIGNVLRSAQHCAKDTTTWLLPRGRAADASELSKLKRSMFHVEHSRTDPASAIVIVRGDGR